MIKDTNQKSTDLPIGGSQTSQNTGDTSSAPNTQSNSQDITPGKLYVINRDSKRMSFDAERINVAITKAYIAAKGNANVMAESVHQEVDILTGKVVDSLHEHPPAGGVIYIEDLQDRVEQTLMSAGEHQVARTYVLYREKQAEKRLENKEDTLTNDLNKSGISVNYGNGIIKPLDTARLTKIIDLACNNLDDVDANLIYQDTIKNIYDGIILEDLSTALVIATHTFMEQEPNYSYVAARLLSDELTRVSSIFLGIKDDACLEDLSPIYKESFTKSINKGIELELLDEKLATFDLKLLSEAIEPKRDLNFGYLGIRTLYDRYLQHWEGKRFELPQVFFMRVAMGLSLEEDDKNKRAIEFYNLLSSFDYMSSTPTLFNSGTRRPQLSSCYISTVPDDLYGIYDAIRDNAMLSKWAGGLGNDWTRVRAMGSKIKGTNGSSQGVVPFLKVANDTAVAVNQGGKRKGALCAYLETWHLDIEEFLDLRKNTGDDRRRTHDMNTANWVPDLFMKRLLKEQDWTLFSPSDTPDLHDLYGEEFEKRYCEYENKAKAGEIKLSRTIPALTLWRKMLSMLFETGHPWITFKDSCNLRSPQQHVGTIHSSNLCTEITLNTSDDEIAVCNLGSINLVQHIKDGKLDREKLRGTVTTAIRMLDNVININYYSVPQAKKSNMIHRPIGMGVMAFQDMLYEFGIPYASEEAVALSDLSTELISYYAIEASSDLAVSRGKYDSYEGSLWSKGILPIDSIDILQEQRGDDFLEMNRDKTLDWDTLRDKVKNQGMRNSNVMAIAPTATIANITGVYKSIEPTYQNLYVASNLSGEFIVINPYLVRDLKAEGLWDSAMINDLKYYDGSVQNIQRVPDKIKNIYKTVFEVGINWLVESNSRRQKWIDQSISLNLYIDGTDGKLLDKAYKMAWFRGLKTTYYLRSLGATTAEKSTISAEQSKLNSVSKQVDGGARVCSINPNADDECEVCQ